MKTFEDFLTNSSHKEIYKEIKKLVVGIDNIDSAFRILSALLSNILEQEIEAIGYKYKLGVSSRYLFDKYGIYKVKQFDHHGQIKNNKEIIATVEPYELGLEGLKNIVKFCEENNLEVQIDGRSPYFPGRTIIIKFIKK